MSAQSAPTQSPVPETGQVAPRRFTRDEYHRMAEVGILTRNDRVELVSGEIIQMSPIGSRHQGVLNLLNHLFQTGLGDRATCALQGPVVLADSSEPQPDLLLLRPRADFYRSAHPVPSDVLLLVEIAESSAAFDRGPKRTLYARSGITEYWVIDLARSVLIAHRRPTADEYGEVSQLDRSRSIAPLAFPDFMLPLADIFA
jgi:Uma2 family endonuclease